MHDVEDVFVVGPPGGLFQSSTDPVVSVYIPPSAVTHTITLTVQVSVSPALNDAARGRNRPMGPVTGGRPIERNCCDRSRVVSALDLVAEGPGFKSQSRRCPLTVLGKLFTPIVPLFTKQQNW